MFILRSFQFYVICIFRPGRASLLWRWRGLCASVWGWSIYPRSESLWPWLSPWWRACVSKPHIFWESSSTPRCSTSTLQGPGDFWAADWEEITEICGRGQLNLKLASAAHDQSSVKGRSRTDWTVVKTLSVWGKVMMNCLFLLFWKWETEGWVWDTWNFFLYVLWILILLLTFTSKCVFSFYTWNTWFLLCIQLFSFWHIWSIANMLFNLSKFAVLFLGFMFTFK